MKQNFDWTDFHSDHARRKKAENKVKFLIDPVNFQILSFAVHCLLFSACGIQTALKFVLFNNFL